LEEEKRWGEGLKRRTKQKLKELKENKKPYNI
jgi:hypothetical protein